MFNWSEVPFVRLLMPFIMGIGCAFYFDHAIPSLSVLMVSLSLPIIWLSTKKLAPVSRLYYSIFIHLFLFCFGYQLIFQKSDFADEHHFRHGLTDQNIAVGVVTGSTPSGRFDRAVVKLEQIAVVPSEAKPASGHLMLMIDRTDDIKTVHPGDRIIIKAAIKPIDQPKNPHAFDYRRINRIRGIHHQAFIKKGDWFLLDSNQEFKWLTKIRQLRQHLTRVLKKHLVTTNEFAVGAAMLLGDKSELQEDTLNAYAGTGATHVMAVSGLHLGIIFLALGSMLRWIRSRHRFFRFFKPAVMIAGIWLFALLTGASPSAMRAAVMFSFLIIGQSLYRIVNIYNTLAISAFSLLCYNPYLLFEIGFQLSYAAVVGIVYFQQKIYQQWIIDNRVGDYLWKLVSVGLAAQLTTFPLCLLYFHQFPIYFWLSGLVVVPGAFLVIGVGGLLFVVESIFPTGAIWLGKLLYGIIWLMNALVFLIRELPAGLIDGIWISASVFVLCYLCVAGVAISINTENRRYLVYSLAAFTLILGIRAFTTVSQKQQQQIVLYHHHRNTLIDFFDGQKVISFQNKTLTQKSINQMAQNNRRALGVNEKHTILLEDKKPWASTHLSYHSGLIRFYENTIALIDAPPTQNCPLAIDFLILYNNPALSIHELQKHYDFNEVWIATSNKAARVKQWEAECQQLNLFFRTVRTEGALVKKLNTQ